MNRIQILVESGVNNNCVQRSKYGLIFWGFNELKEVMNKMDHKSKEYKNFFINNINSGQNSESESLKDIELGFIKDMFVVMSVFFGFITLVFVFEIIVYFCYFKSHQHLNTPYT